MVCVKEYYVYVHPLSGIHFQGNFGIVDIYDAEVKLISIILNFTYLEMQARWLKLYRRWYILF